VSLSSLSFHHVGVVTSDLAASTAFYERLGYRPSPRIDDPIQKVGIVLLEKDGSPMVELVFPSDPTSPAAGWLKRIRVGPYHTCYEVPDLEAAVESLRAEGLTPTSEPVPAVAFGGRRIVFLWGTACGLLELLESPR
jgi:methylmalonyl-CoA/ethylmalonyl-CoA epimerase